MGRLGRGGRAGVRLGLADLQTRAADQHREQALDLAEGSGEGPTERTVRHHSAPPARTLVRENTQPSYPWGMSVREMLRQLRQLPQDAEVLAFEAGCEEYCERKVDEVELQGGQV